MPSIESRMIALADALQRRQMEQQAPVDPLSLSLFEFQGWLATLDERDKAELLESLNSPADAETDSFDLTLEGLERWIEGVK